VSEAIALSPKLNPGESAVGHEGTRECRGAGAVELVAERSSGTADPGDHVVAVALARSGDGRGRKRWRRTARA
jgi:hypothetical protein